MQSIVTDQVAWSVCLSVGLCRSGTLVSPAKTAEAIVVPFGLWARTQPRNHELVRDRDPREKGQFLGKGSHIVK